MQHRDAQSPLRRPACPRVDDVAIPLTLKIKELVGRSTGSQSPIPEDQRTENPLGLLRMTYRNLPSRFGTFKQLLAISAYAALATMDRKILDTPIPQHRYRLINRIPLADPPRINSHRPGKPHPSPLAIHFDLLRSNPRKQIGNLLLTG